MEAFYDGDGSGRGRAAVNVAERIRHVEGALATLIREWERFFAGDRRVPPEAERSRLERQLRILSEQPVQRSADEFRIGQLQHRFMTYQQSWKRNLRALEEGRGARVSAAEAGRPAEPAPSAPAERPERSLDPSAAPNPAPNAAASQPVHTDESLFERYVAAKRNIGQRVRLDRAAFEAQLEAQRSRVEGSLGRSVRFEVVVDGDKVRLAVRDDARGRSAR